MLVLIDTNVFMYAAGRQHVYRGPCRSIVRALAQEQPRLDGKTPCVDTELFQELAYRYSSIGKPVVGERLQRSLLALSLRVLPVDANVVASFVEQQRAHRTRLEGRQVSMRDLLHLAVMIEHGVEHILTADRDFESFAGITRLDPRKVRIAES